MVYTTMTRQKLFRLKARGWYFTERLWLALHNRPSAYYEVAVVEWSNGRRVLTGDNYVEDDS